MTTSTDSTTEMSQQASVYTDDDDDEEENSHGEPCFFLCRLFQGGCCDPWKQPKTEHNNNATTRTTPRTPPNVSRKSYKGSGTPATWGTTDSYNWSPPMTPRALWSASSDEPKRVTTSGGNNTNNDGDYQRKQMSSAKPQETRKIKYWGIGFLLLAIDIAIISLAATSRGMVTAPLSSFAGIRIKQE